MMDEDGAIEDEFNIANDHDGIAGLASRLTMDDRVVMESTGSVWTSLYNHLDALHIPVVLANPLKTRAIASARIKSDAIDARILAHLLRADLIPESYVPPVELREVRTLVGHCASIVNIRTMVKNRVHALLDRNGISTSEYSDTFGKNGTERLRTLNLQPLDRLCSTTISNI